MAKQTWDNPINKHTDWGGDASTTNLPVCGARVQEFIKNTFEIEKVYKTLSSLIKEKDKNYIRAQKSKMLSIPEAFENIKKKYLNK